jgi:lipoate-protein ligase A
MNLIKFKSKDALQLFHTFLVNQKQGTVFCVHDEKMVLVPKAKVVNETMCYEMGYKILEEPYSGGVIVSNIGDIWVVDFGEIKNDFAKRFSSYIIDFLKSKGLEASYQDNDILVDGYKVSGSVVNRYSNITFSAFHLGINTNLEDIKKICTKPMKKIPKGLSEYGITTEEVEQMFLDFCEQENKKLK